jgi:hypothetical protein
MVLHGKNKSITFAQKNKSDRQYKQ